MPENITKIPTHLIIEIYSSKINKDTNGTITNDNAKNGYAKLRLNFDRMINQSMKPPAYKGIAIRIHGLLNIDRRAERVLFQQNKYLLHMYIFSIATFKDSYKEEFLFFLKEAFVLHLFLILKFLLKVQSCKFFTFNLDFFLRCD